MSVHLKHRDRCQFTPRPQSGNDRRAIYGPLQPMDEPSRWQRFIRAIKGEWK